MKQTRPLTILLPALAACGGLEIPAPHEAPAPRESQETPGEESEPWTEECFAGPRQGGGIVPLTKILHAFRVTDQGSQVDVVVIFNREFADLTYGKGAVGWDKHSFKDLVGSDHTELSFRDANGSARFVAKVDLLSQDSSAPSGYASLGPLGGDGKVREGDPAHVLDFGSSLDDNFNRFGYVLTESSPDTDERYLPNPGSPNWNYYVEYRLSVAAEAFEPAGFGSVEMAMVHASPSKWGTNSVEVEPSPCPEQGSPEDPFPSGSPQDPPPSGSPDDPSETCSQESCASPDPGGLPPDQDDNPGMPET